MSAHYLKVLHGTIASNYRCEDNASLNAGGFGDWRIARIDRMDEATFHHGGDAKWMRLLLGSEDGAGLVTNRTCHQTPWIGSVRTLITCVDGNRKNWSEGIVN